MVLFSSFCVAYFGQKTNFKTLPIYIFKVFGRYDMKAIFEPIDLKFGIYMVNTYMTPKLYVFLNYNLKKQVFSLHLLF